MGRLAAGGGVREPASCSLKRLGSAGGPIEVIGFMGPFGPLVIGRPSSPGGRSSTWTYCIVGASVKLLLVVFVVVIDGVDEGSSDVL